MKAPAGFEHIDIIGQLATNLTSTGFCQAVEQAADAQSVVALLNQKPVIDQAHFEAMLVKNPIKPVDGAKKQKILFLSACQEGLVNVRLANQQMMEAIEPTGNDLRIETHDAYEVERPFNASQIKQANLIIVASDQNIDLSRFAGKKVYQTSTSAVIADAKKVLNEASSQAKVYKLKQSSINKDFDEITIKAPKEKKPTVLDHIMAGISYMLPALVLGGILVAFSLGISTQVASRHDVTITKPSDYFDQFHPLSVLYIIGQAAIALTAPLFAAYIANSIAGKSAIVPAMVAAFVANNKDNIYLYKGMSSNDIVPLGFIGAIIAGLCIGYFVR
jgi:PTS system fructose-specific IIC component